MFKTILEEIRERGRLSDTAIAKRLGVTQPTISRLRSGAVANPLHPLGEQIKDLHKKVCGEKLEAA